MFKRRTLFVIGAGASREVGLPVGAGLASIISKNLQAARDDFGRLNLKNRTLYDQLCRSSPSTANEYFQAFKRISEGVILQHSIDDFLHIHRQDQHLVEVGKAAIVQAILQAESESDLAVDRTNIYNIPQYVKFANAWYIKIMRILGQGTSVAGAKEALSNTSFIIFNYDRCLEHFLQFSLQQLYGIPEHSAIELVTNASIIHPYGSIGALDRLPFGGNKHLTPNFHDLSKQIRTYTEQIEEGGTVAAIRNEVTNANCIVFLGFAFHDQNLSLLHPGGRLKGKEVFGTAFGMSDNDTNDVVGWLAELFPSDVGTPTGMSRHNIKLENKLKCTELFDSYTKSIAG